MSTRSDQLIEEIRSAAKNHDADEVGALSERLVKELRDDVARDPKAFLRDLKVAVGEFDRPRAEELCEMLVAHLRTRARPYPFGPSKEILKLLRRQRHFDLMTKVADALIQSGQRALEIRRQYAQALLDQGLLTAGFDSLRILERDCVAEKNEDELAEVRGLLGRARKQAYMDAAVLKRPGAALRGSLQEAITSYADVFKKKKSLLWHGINTVALLDRARRDKVPVGKSLPDIVASAKGILKQIAAKKKVDVWDLATAGEACLATKDYKTALDWIVKYTQAEGADAFEFAGTLRQFQEVWKLDETKKPQAKILHLLRSALLRQEGGRIEITSPREELATVRDLEADASFEQVLGTDRYKTFRWYRRGLDRAAGVAKIVDRNGHGHGTGFLLRSSDVHADIASPLVLVTNAHVISDDPAELSGEPASLPPDEVRVRFEAGDQPDEEFEVDELLFTSSRRELDCTIVSLMSEPPHEKPFPIARRLPLVNKNQRVYVIGHPRGGGLSFSIDDNLLLDHQSPKLHYRAPTEGGSSGSPVFNQNWDLIGLHHAGGMRMRKLNDQPGTYAANEGIAFQSVLGAIRAKLG